MPVCGWFALVLERRHFDAVDHVLVAFKAEDEEFAVGDGKRVRLDHFGQSERLFDHGALGINHQQRVVLRGDSQKLVTHGFKTHEQVTRELGGGDWEANVEQLKAENAKLAEAGGARITNLPSSGADGGEGGSGEDEGKGENA